MSRLNSLNKLDSAEVEHRKANDMNRPVLSFPKLNGFTNKCTPGTLRVVAMHSSSDTPILSNLVVRRIVVKDI